jgi:hypothetical protein
MRYPAGKTDEFYLSRGMGVNVVRREMAACAATGSGAEENQGVSDPAARPLASDGIGPSRYSTGRLTEATGNVLASAVARENPWRLNLTTILWSG